ncbi:hypothetical protein B0H13DRAFT_1899243 [Mycena leptocephala]|nr:hypothetical protein B0H13DRAFT_1899243 [Mycena leptocephala]
MAGESTQEFPWEFPGERKPQVQSTRDPGSFLQALDVVTLSPKLRSGLDFAANITERTYGPEASTCCTYKTPDNRLPSMGWPIRGGSNYSRDMFLHSYSFNLGFCNNTRTATSLTKSEKDGRSRTHEAKGNQTGVDVFKMASTEGALRERPEEVQKRTKKGKHGDPTGMDTKRENSRENQAGETKEEENAVDKKNEGNTVYEQTGRGTIKGVVQNLLCEIGQSSAIGSQDRIVTESLGANEVEVQQARHE